MGTNDLQEYTPMTFKVRVNPALIFLLCTEREWENLLKLYSLRYTTMLFSNPMCTECNQEGKSDCGSIILIRVQTCTERLLSLRVSARGKLASRIDMLPIKRSFRQGFVQPRKKRYIFARWKEGRNVPLHAANIPTKRRLVTLKITGCFTSADTNAWLLPSRV